MKTSFIFTLLLSLGILQAWPFTKVTAQPAAAEVIFNPVTGLITTETGGQATFTVELSQAPTSAVKVGLDSANKAEGILSTTSITINRANWNIPQVVIITGQDDTFTDGDINYLILTGPVVSSDTNFDGLDPFDVSVTNWDDEGGPVANDDQEETEEGKAVTTDVLLNDTLPISTTFTVTVTTTPANGTTLVNNDNTITDTPTSGFAGQDSYEYQVCDSRMRCDFASVSINIKDITLPSLDWSTPLSNTQVYTVEEDEEVELKVTTSDNVGVASVLYNRWDPVQEKYVDIAHVTEPPFTSLLDTRELLYGWNQVFARALDAAGNLSERQFIWFYKPYRVFMPITEK